MNRRAFIAGIIGAGLAARLLPKVAQADGLTVPEEMVFYKGAPILTADCDDFIYYAVTGIDLNGNRVTETVQAGNVARVPVKEVTSIAWQELPKERK